MARLGDLFGGGSSRKPHLWNDSSLALAVDSSHKDPIAVVMFEDALFFGGADEKEHPHWEELTLLAKAVARLKVGTFDCRGAQDEWELCGSPQERSAVWVLVVSGMQIRRYDNLPVFAEAAEVVRANGMRLRVAGVAPATTPLELAQALGASELDADVVVVIFIEAKSQERFDEWTKASQGCRLGIDWAVVYDKDLASLAGVTSFPSVYAFLPAGETIRYSGESSLAALGAAELSTWADGIAATVNVHRLLKNVVSISASTSPWRALLVLTAKNSTDTAALKVIQAVGRALRGSSSVAVVYGYLDVDSALLADLGVDPAEAASNPLPVRALLVWPETHARVGCVSDDTTCGTAQGIARWAAKLVTDFTGEEALLAEDLTFLPRSPATVSKHLATTGVRQATDMGDFSGPAGVRFILIKDGEVFCPSCPAALENFRAAAALLAADASASNSCSALEYDLAFLPHPPFVIQDNNKNSNENDHSSHRGPAVEPFTKPVVVATVTTSDGGYSQHVLSEDQTAPTKEGYLSFFYRHCKPFPFSNLRLTSEEEKDFRALVTTRIENARK